MIRDHFDHIFILNMARSMKRRAMCLYQSSLFGLSNAEIIRAVDGKKLDLEKMISEGVIQRDGHKKRALTPGEVGCFLSHVNAWKTIMERKINTALICEDDIVWRLDANEIVDHFMAEVPGDWDIIHFYSTARVGSGMRNDPGRKKISSYVWRGYNECGGGVCYAITARGASFLLDNAFPIRHAIDGGD